MDKKEIIKRIDEVKEKSKKRNFRQSVEICVNFKEIDIESSEYKLNLNVFLPKGRGKDINIGIFADGDMNVKAKKISRYVLSRSEIEGYTESKRDMRKFANSCYSFIAQQDLMPVIGKNWGIVLAPRGKMPEPVPSNIDLEKTIERLKNTVRIRSKKNPTVQVTVGTEDMNSGDIADNIIAVMTAIERKITTDKIRSVYFKTTMGPVIKLL